jgi:hypothetical protein
MKLAGIAVAVVVSLSLAVAAQEKPDFSGRWIVVTPERFAGREQVVTHDAKALTTEYPDVTPPRKTVVLLDGYEHRGTVASRVGEVVTLTRAAWEGGKLVIYTATSYPNGMKTTSKETWSFDAPGRLVIDSTESGPGGAPGPSSTIVLKKAGSSANR